MLLCIVYNCMDCMHCRCIAVGAVIFLHTHTQHRQHIYTLNMHPNSQYTRPIKHPQENTHSLCTCHTDSTLQQLEVQQFLQNTSNAQLISYTTYQMLFGLYGSPTQLLLSSPKQTVLGYLSGADVPLYFSMQANSTVYSQCGVHVCVWWVCVYCGEGALHCIHMH